MSRFTKYPFLFAVTVAYLAGCTHAVVDRKPQMITKSTSIPVSVLIDQVEIPALQPEAADQDTEQDVNRQDQEPVKTTTIPPINITPLTTFSNATTARVSNFRNSYTRILITSSLAAPSADTAAGGNGPEDILPYQPRNAFRRFFWGYKRDINLSAKIKIGEYESTTPLITLSHQSNSDGELWSRSISHKRLDFPLFLVKEDGGASVPDIRFSLAGSKDYTSNMAGIALQVAVSAIQQVAPETSVLTKLSEQSTKDTSRAIDSAIGKLFSSGISEEHISDCDFRKWDSKGGIKIRLNIPKKEEAWDSELREVGRWMISFDDPRPSIFSNWRICEQECLCKATRAEALAEVHKEINPGQVLNYSLVKSGNALGTIRSYVLQQNWYVTAQTSFKGTAPEDLKTAEALCRNMHNEITGLGLNGDDANIVIWAVAKGLPVANSMHASALSADTCNVAISKIEAARQEQAAQAPTVPH